MLGPPSVMWITTLSIVRPVAVRKFPVAAGTRLHRLPELFEPYGLALQNMGDIDRQTISGATSTGTHGTGLAFGGLATQIVAARLVTGEGELIRVAPDVIQKIDQLHADRSDSRAIGRVIAPWGRRIGSLRFETDGAWKRQGSVDVLAKELRLALQYPEGASV